MSLPTDPPSWWITGRRRNADGSQSVQVCSQAGDVVWLSFPVGTSPVDDAVEAMALSRFAHLARLRAAAAAQRTPCR